MKHLYPLFTFILALLTACAPESQTSSIQATAAASTYFPISVGDQILELQLALNPREQSKGLMHRDSMEENHGMLFLFKQPEPRAFWMRNTRIPLDIGYFDANGTLLEIHALYPYDENTVKSRSQAVQIAVETNRGWFARNQITAGAQIDFEALAHAIRARGQSPANFSIQNAE